MAFLDTRPVFKGHVLVVPREHLVTLAELPADLLPGYFGLVQRLAVAVETGLGAGGTFVAMNNKVSQSVPHLHTHVVPRTKGDGLRGFFWPRTRYDDDDRGRRRTRTGSRRRSRAGPDRLTVARVRKQRPSGVARCERYERRSPPCFCAV